ncbi:MAG: response regulator [Oligoflexia bacterium]|nr:response regulator [Oligoflexia bacterium]
MKEKCLNVVSDAIQEIIQKMTSLNVVDLDVQINSNKTLALPFSYIISFFSEDKKISGDFILGFPDKGMALSLASSMAQNLNLSALDNFDDFSNDLLLEFTNILTRKIILNWSKLDFFSNIDIKINPIMTFNNCYIEPSSNNNSKNSTSYLLTFNSPFFKLIFRTLINANDLNVIESIQQKILVVEDSKTIRHAIIGMLKNCGYSVEEASSGEEALEKYNLHRPTLTLMDIYMPKMNGITTMQIIRFNYPQAKFVVLSSGSKEENKIVAQNLNICSYLVNPINLVSIKSMVQDIISGIESNSDKTKYKATFYDGAIEV